MNFIKPIWANRDKTALAQEKAYSEQEAALAQEEAYKEAEQMHAATPKKKGKGVQTIILPSDPEELVNKLVLLKGSFDAGNNGVRNEIIAICDELKRQGIMRDSDYKTFMLQIV